MQRSFCFFRTLALSGLVSAVVSAGAAAQAGTDPAIRDHFDVEKWSLQDLSLPGGPWDDFNFRVELDGKTYMLAMLAHSMRSPEFQFITVDETGSHVEQDVPPSNIYKGDVVDLESGESIGATSGRLDEGGMFTGIALVGDGKERLIFGIQPLRELYDNAPANRHVVYNSADSIWDGVQCGNHLLPNGGRTGEFGSDDDSDIEDTGDKLCEIAFDCDFAFYQWNNSNARKTLRDTETVCANMELIYERDVDIGYEITRIIVRKSSGSDPYSTNDPVGLLNQFQSHWCNTKTRIGRDVAHLMTGRNLSGSVIGIAWLGVICSSLNCNGFGYGLSQSSWTSNMTNRVALTAHECGHNWNADHCDGDSDCQIMCSGLGGCGSVTSFGARAIGRIGSHRNSRPCLDDDVGPIFLPVVDDFPTKTLDPQWVWTNAANINGQGSNEPSAPYSLRLNAAGPEIYRDDQIRLAPVDASSAGTVNLSYYWEARGTESGEKMITQAYTAGRNWTVQERHISDGSLMDNFVFFSEDLAPNTVHAYTRVRFKVKCNEINDKFFVDNFRLTDLGGLSGDDDVMGPVYRGDMGTNLRVIGAHPNTPVSFFVSFDGENGNITNDRHKKRIELRNPIYLGEAIADDLSYVTFEMKVPADFPASTIYFQAVIWDSKFTDGHEVTNIRVMQIQP